MKHFLTQNLIYILACLFFCLLIPQNLSLADFGFSDAIALPYQQSTKCNLPAYDARYYYFLGTDTANTTVSTSDTVISVTPSGKYRISLYDSHGIAVPLSKTDTDYTFVQSTATKQRYFLRIQNLSSQDLTLSIALRFSSTGSNKKSTQTPPSPTNKVKKRTKKSVAKTATPKKSSKPKSSATSHTNKLFTFTPSSPSPTNKSSNNSTSSKSSASRKNRTSPSIAPPTVTNHFVRIKKGTSLAIVEKIIQNSSSTVFSVEASSPDVSVTNGILYVPKTGLYYLTLQSKSITTTCTLCVY